MGGMLTVKELTDKLPGIEIGELKEGVKYIVRLPDFHPSANQLVNIRDTLRRFGVEALVVPAGMEFFEIVD